MQSSTPSNAEPKQRSTKATQNQCNAAPMQRRTNAKQNQSKVEHQSNAAKACKAAQPAKNLRASLWYIIEC
jgi:hypothetical protein